MKKILFIIISIMLLIGITTTANNNNVITPKAEKGNLDLSQWNFQEQGNLELDGQWQFYWDKLLDYKTVKTDNTGTYEEVPKVWSRYMVNGNKIPGKGYATYKLHVNSKIPAGTIMGFRISNFSSAYNLYINETLVASNGKVGKNISEEIGEYRPEASVFMVPAKEFDIIIQVSNFHYARGGFWSSISLGDYEKILKLNDSIYGKEYFVLGALLVVIVFYLIIFFLDREVKYNLYFTLLCMMLAILMDVEGQFLLLALFPNLSINTIIFILYSSSTWVIYLLILYLDELFNSEFSSIVLKLFLVISIFDEITYIILPTTTYTEYGLIHNYIEIVGVFCALIIVIIGLKKKKKYVGLNIFSMVIVLVTYIHDILFMTNKIKSSFGGIIIFGIIYIYIYTYDNTGKAS